MIKTLPPTKVHRFAPARSAGDIRSSSHRLHDLTKRLAKALGAPGGKVRAAAGNKQMSAVIRDGVEADQLIQAPSSQAFYRILASKTA